MGLARAVDAKAEQGRATAHDLDAIGMGCDPVHCDDGMPMDATAEGFSSLHDGAVLFLWPARQRGVGLDQ